DQTDSVLATGLDSHAIFAQSVGGTGGDNITIRLHSGMVSGGGGTAAGIYLDGGATNSIAISPGAVVTAASGMAIQGTDGVDRSNVSRVIGNTSVTNSGSIFGNVDLGSGVGALSNLATATFVPGTTVNLGGGAFTNSGRLDPGGANNIVTTAVTGNFVQNQTGVLAVDAKFGAASDRLAVTGTANVRGSIEPKFSSLLPNAPTNIVTASGGFVGTNDVTAVNSPSVTYGVQIAGNNLQLFVQSAQFLPPALASKFSPSETGVANQLQNIWNNGATPGMGETFAYFANLTDPVAYAAALDRLHPAPYTGQVTAATNTGLAFTDAMMSCRAATGPYAPLYETECDWAKITGTLADKGQTSSSSGYSDRSARIQVGRQVKVAPDWFFELAAGYEAGRTAAGTFAVTHADRYDFGAALKHQVGSWLFAAALDGGYASLNTTRYIGFAGAQTASSNAGVWRLDARFRAAYLYEFGSSYLKPTMDVDVIYSAIPSFNETGAGVLDLQVASMSNVVYAATPMVEFGQTLVWTNGQALRPYVQAGATFLSKSSTSISATLEGAPVGTAPFVTTTTFPTTLGKLSAGFDLFALGGIQGFDMRVQYEARFAHDYKDPTGSVKFTKRF
ncbi:MAG: autotransporter outer membrane beta-barrel domain-containing protein, partial [Xanthobacteraceae bacterium]